MIAMRVNRMMMAMQEALMQLVIDVMTEDWMMSRSYDGNHLPKSPLRAVSDKRSKSCDDCTRAIDQILSETDLQAIGTCDKASSLRDQLTANKKCLERCCVLFLA